MGIIKKSLAITAATGLVLAIAAAWGPLSSYVRTSARLAGNAMHDSVPNGFEIERIRTMVDDLDAVVAEQEARLIEQRVDLEYLEEEVGRCAERVERLRAEVVAAREILAEDRATYTIGGEEYPRAEVVREAQAKAEALTRTRAILTAKRETMGALEDALSTAEAQIARARDQRETYGLRLANLQAQAETVAVRKELATTLDDLPEAIDAGAFNEVEQAFTRVERELEVQGRVLDRSFEQVDDDRRLDFLRQDEADVLGALDRALATEPPAADPALSMRTH